MESVGRLAKKTQAAAVAPTGRLAEKQTPAPLPMIGSSNSTNAVPTVNDLTPPKKGIISKVASGVGSVAKAVTEDVARLGVTGASAIEDTYHLLRGQREKAVRTETGYDVPIYGPLKPYKLGKDITITKDASGKETVSGGGFGKETLETVGAGLSIGTLFTGGGEVGAVAKGGVKAIAKKGVLNTVKQAATKQAAKRVLADFTLGALGGGGTELQNPDATPKSVAIEAAKSGAFTVALPRVVGGTLKLAGKTASRISEKAGQTLDNVAAKLEQKAAPKAVQKERFYEQVAKPVATTGEKLAGKVASGIRAVQQAPAQIKTHLLDRYAPILSFQEKARAAGVNTPDLHELVQGTGYRAGGQAENRLDDYLAIRSANANDWGKVKELSHYLDDVDRISRGQTVAGNRTLEQVTGDMEKLKATMQPGEFERVMQGQQQIQGFLKQELQLARESGRISQEQFDAMQKAYPNYIPHDVLDFLDEARGGMGRSMNMAQSGFKRAVGSTRELRDIDETIVDRIARNHLLNEKNKTVKAVVDTGKQLGEQGGFVPLRTAENVKERRAIYEELSNLSDERDRIQTSLRAVSSKDSGLVKKLDQLNAEIDDLSKSAIELFTSQSADDAPKLQALLTKRVNSNNVTRAAEKERARVAVDIALRDERLKNVKGTISRAEGELASKMKEHEPLLFSTIERPPTPKESISIGKAAREIEQAQNKVIAALTERERLLAPVDEKLKLPEPKVSYKLENKGPTTKQSVEALIRDRNSKIEDLKARILKRETKLTDAEAEKFATEQQLDQLLSTMEDKKARMKKLYEDSKLYQDVEAKRVDFEKEGFEKVSYFNDGIREDWLVPKDVGRSLKNMDAAEATGFLKWLNETKLGQIAQGPAKATRYLSTTVNPVFALFRNPVRDVQSALITTDVVAKDYAFGLIKAIVGPDKSDEFYRLARESGALQGGVYREGKDATEILLRKLDNSNILSKVARPDNIVSSIGEKLEEMTRLAAFKNALDKGLEPMQAAKIARNATVDFGKMGASMQAINKIIPFLNARVQGASNLVSAIKRDPTQAARKLMWSAGVPSLILNHINNKYESYQNIPDNEKRKFWIVMVGETEGRDYQNKPIHIPHYVKIPKGESQQVVSNVIDRVLNIGRLKYPDSTAEFVGKIVGDFSPVTDSSLVPPGLSQAIELKTNYSLFRDKKIVPDYIKIGDKFYRSDEIEPKYRSLSYTSSVAKAIGQLMNWSPAKVDYAIKIGALGDILRFGDVADTLKKSGQSTFEKAANLPFVSGLIGTQSSGESEARKNYETEQIQQKNTPKIERQIERTKQKQTSRPAPVGRLANP